MSTKSLLKEYIRLTVEAATTVSQAKAAGYALYTFKEGDEIVACLYQPKVMIKDIQNIVDEISKYEHPVSRSEEIIKVMEKHFVGMGVITKNVRGECYGSYEVVRAAADKGLGPLIYSILAGLAPNHLLTPDRASVSPSASNIWDKMSKRSDVKKLPLDNEAEPTTPPTDDDCELHLDPERPYLDDAYQIPPAGDIESLLDAGQEFLADFGFILDGIELADEPQWILGQAARGYFVERYTGQR